MIEYKARRGWDNNKIEIVIVNSEIDEDNSDRDTIMFGISVNGLNQMSGRFPYWIDNEVDLDSNEHLRVIGIDLI